MTAEQRPPSRWWLYGPLIAGAVIFALYAALWLEGAQQMRRSIAMWADDQRAAGLEVRYDAVKTEGFPFFLRGAVNDVSIGDGGAWRWRAPKLFIDALPLAPDRLIFSARDEHAVDIAGAGRWRIDAPDGRASIQNDNKRLWIVDIESGASRLARADGDEEFDADHFLMTIAPAEENHQTIEASLAISNLSAQMSASAFHAPSVGAMIAVRNSTALETSPRAWRDAGGALELRRVVINAEDAKLTLSGDLTLDSQGRPAGSLQVEAVNPGNLARALGEAGVINAKEAETIAATLTLASLAGGGVLRAPLVLKDGAASIAGVRIAALPSVF